MSELTPKKGRLTRYLVVAVRQKHSSPDFHSLFFSPSQYFALLAFGVVIFTIDIYLEFNVSWQYP